MNERLSRLVALYERNGRIEAIEGAGADVASVCLARAEERLSAAVSLFASGFYESAYTTAYDAHRGAAEAVVLLHGYRVTSARGVHEATHEFAAAAVDASSPFDNAPAAAFRAGRNESEYFDPSRPTNKTQQDAEWALDQARRACEVVSALL